MYVDGNDRWEAKKDHNVVLKEAAISGEEHRLLRLWIELSEGFARLATNGEPLRDPPRDPLQNSLGDPRDDDVNSTQVARGLDWTEPDGRAEPGALIAKISGKLRASPQHLAVDTNSVEHWDREKSRAVVREKRSVSQREDLKRNYSQ